MLVCNYTVSVSNGTLFEIIRRQVEIKNSFMFVESLPWRFDYIIETIKEGNSLTIGSF